MPKLTEIPREKLRKSDSYDLTEKLMNQGYRLFRGENYTPNLEICNYFLLGPNAKPNEGPFELDYDRLSDLVRSTINITNTTSTLPQGLSPLLYGNMLSSSEKLVPYLAEIIEMCDGGLIEINGISGQLPNKKLYEHVNALKLLIEKLQNSPIGATTFRKTFDNLVRYSNYMKISTQVAENTDSQIGTIYSLNLIERQRLLKNTQT